MKRKFYISYLIFTILFIASYVALLAKYWLDAGPALPGYFYYALKATHLDVLLCLAFVLTSWFDGSNNQYYIRLSSAMLQLTLYSFLIIAVGFDRLNSSFKLNMLQVFLYLMALAHLVFKRRGATKS